MTQSTIERGDRFESKDWREQGRIVQVVEVFDNDTYRVRNDENPKNTSTVGRETTISRETLTSRWDRLSR